jgi:cytochrome b561
MHYARAAIVLHWLMALLMVANVALGLSVDHLPDSAVRPVIDTHKSIGILVLGLVLMRLLWRLTHSPPALPSSYTDWERQGARWAHVALYLLMFAIPLSGWMHDSAWKDAATHPMRLFTLVPWPRISAIANMEPLVKEQLHTLFGQWHRYFADALYLLLAVHVGAALKHQFLDREPQMQRMWFIKD